MNTSRVHRVAVMACLGCLLLAFGAGGPARAHGSSVSYTQAYVAGMRLNVVTVNLDDPEVKVSAVLARNGVGSSEPFKSFIAHTRPAAAITGTFFSIKSLIPVGDIVIGGCMVHIGPVGTGICFTPDNKVVFVHNSEGRKSGWFGYDSVICTGPRLIRDGRVCVDPCPEGFHDRSLFCRRPRAAAGVTRWNRLVLVTVNRPVYLSELARAMRKIGAINAVGLDGGTSSALYYKGSYITHPGRRLTNILKIDADPRKVAKLQAVKTGPPKQPETGITPGISEEPDRTVAPLSSISRLAVSPSATRETESEFAMLPSASSYSLSSKSWQKLSMAAQSSAENLYNRRISRSISLWWY